MPKSDVNPNQDVIAGLREVADLLERHPELPKVRHAMIAIGAGAVPNPIARQELTAVARALGDNARERRSSHSIEIQGGFGRVELYAEGRVEDLGPRFEPAPILPVRVERVA